MTFKSCYNFSKSNWKQPLPVMKVHFVIARYFEWTTSLGWFKNPVSSQTFLKKSSNSISAKKLYFWFRTQPSEPRNLIDINHPIWLLVGIFQKILRKMRQIIWKWNTVFGISVCMMSISWASSILKNSFIFCLLPFFLLLAECSFILVVCVLFWVHALFSQKSSKKITNLTN